MSVMTELFANPGTANPVVTSSVTTTPASGTSETWTITGLAGVFPAVSSAASPPTFCRCTDPAHPAEILWITNISGTTATVTRGAEGTTAVSHGSGFQLELLITGGGLGSFAQGWPGLVNTLATKTAAYTLTAADYIILANAATAAFTLTLPTAAGAQGRTYKIKKTDSSGNAVTIATTASQTIDGAASYTLTLQWQYVEIISDGSNWQVIDAVPVTTPLLLDAAVPIGFSLASVAGTDNRNSDAYAGAITGNIRNWQPSSNPRVVETWHNVSPPAGWSLGFNRYKNLAEYNLVLVDVQLVSGGLSGNVTAMTLPSGYRPSGGYSFPLAITTSATTWPNTLRISVTTAGVVQTSGLPSGTTGFFATFVMPLD